MRKIYLLLLLQFIIGYSNANQIKLESLESDSTICSIFNKSEIADLNLILDFFTKQICSTKNTKNSQPVDCYLKLFERLNEETKTGRYEIRISFSEQNKLYQKIHQSTFNAIWDFHKCWLNNNPDTLKCLTFKYDGKYTEFLDKLGSEYEVINKYHNDFKAAYDISASMIAGLIYNYNQYNIEDIRIKLVVAIHYLTLNDIYERNEKY